MADPLFLYKLRNGLLGTASPELSPEQGRASQNDGLMNFGAALLAGSGPTREPVGLGAILGNAVMQGRAGKQQSEANALNNMLIKKKIDTAIEAVAEYQYAVKNGFKGTIEEWKRVASAKPTVPSAIQEYNFFKGLDEEGRKDFLSLQRTPVLPQIVDINGVKNLVDRTQTDTDKAIKPLTSLSSEIDAISRKARAEAEAKALGGATGEAKGGLQKKAINALNVLDSLDLADPLVDVATGSTVGAATDAVASFFGKSMDGDQATAQLKIIQANLMTNMPRMEGPQSDRDVQLYREAAGELGDPTVPRARKKAAISMIRALQQKYAETAEKPEAGAPPKKETAAERAKRLGL